jgi:hypothetical protein
MALLVQTSHTPRTRPAATASQIASTAATARPNKSGSTVANGSMASTAAVANQYRVGYHAHATRADANAEDASAALIGH